MVYIESVPRSLVVMKKGEELACSGQVMIHSAAREAPHIFQFLPILREEIIRDGGRRWCEDLLFLEVAHERSNEGVEIYVVLGAFWLVGEEVGRGKVARITDVPFL